MQVKWAGGGTNHTDWGKTKTKHSAARRALANGDVVGRATSSIKKVGRAGTATVDDAVFSAKRAGGDGCSGVGGRRVDRSEL